MTPEIENSSNIKTREMNDDYYNYYIYPTKSKLLIIPVYATHALNSVHRLYEARGELL